MYTEKILEIMDETDKVGKTFMLEGLEVSLVCFILYMQENEKFQRCLGS